VLGGFALSWTARWPCREKQHYNKEMIMMKGFLGFLAAVLLLAVAVPGYADECTNRGLLDTMYCDNDQDLVADNAPAGNCKDPSTLVFTYTPVEDPAVYQDLFSDFQAHMKKVTGKDVIYYTVHSNSAQVEAMRSGRLHIAGFSTGPTGFAVNLAGYVPIAVKGDEKEFQGYNLIMLVKQDSPYQTMADLKGKKVAHTSPSSNSGNLAPRALFPALGLVPDEDYTVVYSGKHDQSVLGVNSGDYDGAAVASDVFHRMAVRGQIKEDDFRVIYRSAKFPTSSFAYAHDLEPAFRDKMVKCFYDYRYTEEMKKAFDGADRFYPINYKEHWAIVRDVAEAGGDKFNKTAYEKEAQREEEARQKKAAEPKK
jgi:phosphonate transport system substrate-binding protein